MKSYRYPFLLFVPLVSAFLLLLPAFGLHNAVAQEKSIHPVPLQEAYDSWKLAKEGPTAPPASISAPEGFAIEMIKAAAPDEGSWVGMAFDDQDRLYVAIEKKGILRLTLSENGCETEKVNDTLLECRGLLWAHQSLYAYANNSRGLFRLEDSDGDDLFDKETLLLKTNGGVGHGRNHLRLGPGGFIYIVHGNDVILPRETSKDSPYRHYGEDQLIPNPWDDDWFNNRAFAPAGHILRTDKEGSFFDVIAGGLRNALDIDFNEQGEPFVYEADMEWETGLAWYKPTRVIHIVSGGDYGWRRATGKWPNYYEDSLPAAYDVGLGSPTGVEFAYRSHFPEPWRSALFIADWSYGRILGVHLTEDGASYSGTADTFVLGRPLNVTDLAFGSDGALYFITGGRRTQSALYRVSWKGDSSVAAEEPEKNKEKTVAKAETETATEPIAEQAAGAAEPSFLNQLRRRLEKWHVEKGCEGAELAKRHIDHPDRWIRFAARVALENQYPYLWLDWARQSGSPRAVMALARLRLATADQLVEQLSEIPFERDRLALLRAYHLVFARCGPGDESTRQNAIAHLSPHFPSGDTRTDFELCELMVFLNAPGAMEKTLDLLEEAESTEELSQYLCFLRYLFPTQQGTVEDLTGYNRRFLKGLRRFESFSGGRWYERTAVNLRKEIENRLTDSQKIELAQWLEPKPKTLPAPEAATEPGVLVKNWRMADFDEAMERPLQARDFENGKQAYLKGRCATCHRAGGIEAAPLANLGPDLTGIGARFGVADMLESIIHPSRAIGDKYRNPAGPNISPMPPGLINTLDRESILDLLAFLQSGGNPEDRVFGN